MAQVWGKPIFRVFRRSQTSSCSNGSIIGHICVLKHVKKQKPEKTWDSEKPDFEYYVK